MRFAQLTRPARAYVLGTYGLALGLLLAVLPHTTAAADALVLRVLGNWPTFVPLLIAATVAHSFPVHTPNRQSYYVSLPFFGAAILMLPSVQLAIVLLVPNLLELHLQRRSWVAQLFNVSVYVICGLAARATYWSLHAAPFDPTDLKVVAPIIAAGCAVAVFLTLNRVLVSGAIALANRLPPFGKAELESLVGEAVLLAMGVPLAALIGVAPWALLPAAGPLLLVPRALEMPHMRAQRRHDELTDLFTRSYLFEVAERELNRAQRFGRPLTLLLMQVVDFDDIVAQHGRSSGDLVSRQVADLLRKTTREYDVAARLGDGFFALLLPECDRERALAIAVRLRMALAQMRMDVPGRLDPLSINLAVGLTTDGGTPATAFGAAERAVAEAVQAGGTIVAATPPLATQHDSASSVGAVAQPAGGDQAGAVRTTDTPTTQTEPAGPRGASARTQHSRLWPLVPQAVVMLAALVVASQHLPAMVFLDGWTTIWMASFVVLGEVLWIELFGRTSYSITMVPIMAAGFLLGPAGAIALAPIGPVVRALHHRTGWRRALFDVSIHVLATWAAIATFRALAPELSVEHLISLLGAAALAGVVFYLHTLIVSTTLSIDVRLNPLRIWAEHFRWMWIQYLVLSTLGLLLALAYHMFGLFGALIFVVPSVMMRYVAKQYLDRTMDHVRQLRALNEHLAREVSQRKKSEASLEHQALHDVLTDLPNRVLLRDRTEQSLLAAKRDNHAMALLLLDLDRFKEVNDTLGHHAGDVLLQQMATRLRAVLRASDTIARLGGDEFAALLPMADADAAIDTAQRLLLALESPFDLDGQPVDVRASIGIALAEGADDTPDALLRRADVAMYAAKKSGTGYGLYAAELDQNSPERLALMADLRGAISNNELELYFQPKLDVRSGQIRSVEALVRWMHPVHGLIAPGMFIPLAESTGLIEQISAWVLDAALDQARQWRELNLDLGVAVNLSMRDLHRADLPDRIATLLGVYGLAPSCLTVEITESMLMADPRRAMDIAGALFQMGVRLAIDDFGTGYSSLAYLKQLPVSELKIDQAFVRQLATNAEDAAIVRSTIGLAHDLGLDLVAEGVEDARSYALLAAYGCDLAQGDYISRPLRAPEIPDAVRGNTRFRSEFPLAA